MDLIEKVTRYVRREFERGGNTSASWPTVAQTAKALKVRQSEIQLIADDPSGPIMLTEYYSNQAFKLGEKWVELNH